MLQRYRDHRNLHSFPTRRSSDLGSESASVLAPAMLLPATEAGPRRRCCCCDGDERRAASAAADDDGSGRDRKSTRLNSSHVEISYAVFCLKKKNSAYPQLQSRIE